MELGGLLIGKGQPPLVVAEMSGNHNQSLDRAIEIVAAAAESGAKALKIQTYTADTLTLNSKTSEFIINDTQSPWHGRYLHDLYSEAHTPWEWHEPIMSAARELGMICFSTPFDETAVDFLEELDVPAYKIASFENTHIPLIRKVAATGKPLIISTGLATIEEITELIEAVRAESTQDFVLLKCTSSYPANEKYSNLLTIPHMRNLFSCGVGLSDHTLGIGVAIASVSLGACVIEKHFTLSRSDGGPDSEFSMEPKEMTALVKEVKRAWDALGEINYGPTDDDIESVRDRRSIYVSEDIKEGDTLTKNNLKIVRPSYGLLPKHIENVIGKSAGQNLKKGTPLQWKYVR